MTAHFPAFTLVIFLLLGALRAADTWDIAFESIEMKSKEPDVQVKVDIGGEDRRPTKIALRWNGKEHEVPVSEFAGITEVSMSSLRIVSTMPPRLVVSPGDNGFALISVGVEYGKRIHMKGLNPVDPEADNSFRRRVFFLFNFDGYCHRERVEPIEKGEHWRLFWKEVAKKEISEGEERGPFPTDDPPLVPVVEWHRPVSSGKAEQDGADQPATAPESNSKDSEEAKPESEGRSQ